GEIRVEGPRRAWPLGLLLARDFVRPRFALAGDAAHGIHPIAGQGLNLGFKDAAALAEIIVEAERLGEDIGAIDVLQRYERWRRFDTVQMGVTTDVLNRLFSNDVGPLRAIRDLGLGLVDRMPGMKDFFIRQASGLMPGIPRLLQGESILPLDRENEMKRHANVVWKGSLTQGSGTLNSQSSAFQETPLTFKARFEDESG